MHVFLTGPIQIGKSTILKKVIDKSGLKTGGFVTFFQDRESETRTLHICPAGTEAEACSDNIIAFFHGYDFQIFTGKFDTLGSEYIRHARESAQLIIMDECGRFESGALDFQNEIFNALDGGIPILGVLKEGDIPWLSRIKQHPGVNVITVSEENRDELPAAVAEMLGIEAS